MKTNTSGSMVLVASMSGYVSNKVCLGRNIGLSLIFIMYRAWIPQAIMRLRQLFTSSLALWLLNGDQGLGFHWSASTLYLQDTSGPQQLQRPFRSPGWRPSGWVTTCCSGWVLQTSFGHLCYLCWATEAVSWLARTCGLMAGIVPGNYEDIWWAPDRYGVFALFSWILWSLWSRCDVWRC